MATKQNPMRDIFIDKLVIQCCAGGEADQFTKASKVLKQLTDQDVAYGKSRLTIRGFGIRRGQKISGKVTVRGKKAQDILDRALKIKDFTLDESCFSQEGHFGFGITEHIALNMKYDPSIGIFGMDFMVVLGRPGGRVSKRKHNRTRIGHSHRITKDEAIQYAKEKLEITVVKK